MSADYIHCYSTLQLQPGCGWPEVRERYRQLVKQWHPDHFQTESERRTADDKIKAINHAFHLLAQYYRRHRALPTVDPIDRPSGIGTPSQTAPSTPPPAATSAATPKSAAHIPMRYAAILAITAATLVGWLHRSETPPAAPPVPRNEPSNAAVEIEHAVPIKNAQEYFTFGSTLGEVHAVQGIPSRIDRNVWYYGNATVQFTNGVVVGWNDDPSGLPLKARIDAPPKSHPHHFGVGSSKVDVMAVQGKPTQMTDAVWDYGSSRVYFRGDRVASWDNSLLNPLKVR